MKNPIRMPLRSLNRKKKKEQLSDQKNKPCPSSPVNLSSTPSITQTSSYTSCTNSLASSTQTRKSAEPPGWVHNPPPRTVNQEVSTSSLLKENNAPMRNSCQYTHSNTPHRQWAQHDMPSPVRIRSLQPMQSENIPSFQRQNMTHMMSDNAIQMTYSESSNSEGSSISSVSGDTLGPFMGLNEESSDEQLDFYRNDCATHSRSANVERQVSFPQTHSREERSGTTMDSAMVVHPTQVDEESDFRDALLSATSSEAAGDANKDTSCSLERGQEEICSAPAVSIALPDMGRMQDIYASMMVAFRKKIMAELREEMQKEVQHQLAALQTELSEMNTRLMNLEKNQTMQQELQHSSSTIETSILKKISSNVLNDSEQQQRRFEAMLDAKLAKAIAGVSVEMDLAVHEVRKEGERLSKMRLHTESPPRSEECSSLTSRNCISTKGKEERLGCESVIINASFAEAMHSIDKFVDDCDNLANDFDTIAYRMSRDEDSDDESFEIS